MAFAEIYAAGQATRINEEVLSLLEDMQRSAQSRYANGLAAQQDMIKVKVEQTMVRVEQELLRGEDQGARVVIVALIGAAHDSYLAEPLTLPELDALLPTYQRLVQTSARETPVLEAADATVRGRQVAHALAKRELLPDLGVGISPVQVGSKLDAWELMFEISVPLFKGKRAMASEAGYMLAAAEEKRSAEILRVRSEAGRTIAEYTAALEQERILQGVLLAESELNFRSALAGYQSGKVDFDTVIEAERQIRQTRLLALAAKVKQQRAAAQFERITGLKI
jgi:outer membrane protein TolC